MASRWLNSSSHRRRADSASTNPDALFDVPAGLAAFHDKVGDKGSLDCGDGAVLDTREGGYGTNGEGEDGTHYCGDKADSPSYIWFESNMDSCCDGAPAGTTGVCETDPSYLPETAYTDADDNPYDAMKIQYVVINMEDGFDATKFGVQPRSVVAVVCGKGGKMTFGVWGETNAQGSMGETSVALGRVCFGEEINGNFGYSAPDVLYIVFPGSEEETIPSGAGSDEDAMFELGQKLVAGAFGGEASSTTTTAKEDDATATASSKTATVEEGGGTSTKEATTATSKPSTTSPAASPSSGSSVDSDITSTSTETEGGLSGLPSTPVLLLIVGVALLIAGLIAWWCISRRKQLSYTRVTPSDDNDRSSRHSRRRPHRGRSHETSRSETETESDEEGSSASRSSSSSEEGEKRRLNEEGRRRRRRR